MPDPIIEPMTIAVELNSPRLRTRVSSGAAPTLFSDVVTVGGRRLVDTSNWFYRNFEKKSLAIFSGFLPDTSAKRPEMTATESAPASITAEQFSSVIPPMATNGLLVSTRAHRTPSVPISGSGFLLLPVGKTGPIAK
jgi:hypothetical protein